MTPQVPSPAPTIQWISADDIAQFQPSVADAPEGLAQLLNTAAEVASGVMFNLSGRQFHGSSTRTVRPCRDTCACFASAPSLGGQYWFWSWNAGYPANWGWRDEVGEKLGCGYLSRVRLAGYPVTDVSEVTIDGEVVDPSGYRLDEYRFLTRMSDPGPPAFDRYWPACQNMALDPTQPGTFAVTYTSGVDPPLLGKLAAAQLAAEVYAVLKGDENRLPSGVIDIVRQGVSMKRVMSTADVLRAGGTGLELVDMFIADANPAKLRRRSAVWSPDLQRFGRRI